jgi:acyl carrier protein
MSIQDRSLAVVQQGVEEFNTQISADQQLLLDADSILFGRDGHLDSMGLVNLLAVVEEHAEDEFDMPITLADERALGQKSNPFRTVGTLVDYLTALVEEQSSD